MPIYTHARTQYLLSMANGGPNTNGGHFSITVAPAPHLNGHYTIFGEVVSGYDVSSVCMFLCGLRIRQPLQPRLQPFSGRWCPATT